MSIAYEQPLRGALHVPEGDGPFPTVVIAHGFKGFMGWGMFPWIADQLADAGFAAVRFDFSGNGVDAAGDFTDLEGFKANTLSREQQDLRALFDAIAAGADPFGGRCRPGRIGILGHSRGGGGVILYAAGDERVAAVATLAGVAHASRFPPEARATAEAQGYFEVLNARTGQQLPVGLEYFRDAEQHDVQAAAAGLAQPLLLVHGTDDEAVSVTDAHLLQQATGGRAQLLEIGGAGHTFGAVHPFQGPTPDLERAMGAVASFFAQHLAAEAAPA